MSKRRKKIPQETPLVEIESLTHEGKGVTHVNGKAVFVDGVLPGEKVEIKYVRVSRRYDEAIVNNLLQASPHRVEPACPHFGVCGGCSLQHIEAGEQIRFKQQVLLDNLKHIGGVEPESVLAPITGEPWGYRRKARMGVKYVFKKEKLLVGFREKRSGYLAELEGCKVLHVQVGSRLSLLAELITGLSIREKLPQIEVAAGDDHVALIFRVLEQPSTADLEKLVAFAKAEDFHLYLQPGGMDSVTPLWPEQAVPLHYALSEFDVSFEFNPTLFTQVNADINGKMVKLALDLLDLNAEDQVLELFCGLGNFTLPMAKRAGHITGIEGDAGLVALAQHNARRNDISNVSYHVANLFEVQADEPWVRQKYNKLLLDPPRTGAKEIVESLPWQVEKVVYVSCNSATLARDAGILVKEKGYRLTRVGAMDMFPHTSHVESIAEFVRG